MQDALANSTQSPQAFSDIRTRKRFRGAGHLLHDDLFLRGSEEPSDIEENHSGCHIHVTDKKAKRKEANRVSAAQSRERRLKLIQDLQDEVMQQCTYQHLTNA